MVSDKKFSVNLPQLFQKGDKIYIKGTLRPDAHQFSINFLNEKYCNISYHMKWIVKPIENCNMKWCNNQNILIENCKVNNDWSKHEDENKGKYINCIDNRFTWESSESAYGNKSKTFKKGNSFFLEYAFGEHMGQEFIKVYNHYNDKDKYELTEYSIENREDIQSIQVWGDVLKIHEISFIYN